MSLPKPDLHVRLSEAAMRELRFLAAAKDVELNKLASSLLERALLGEGHAVRVAARRVLVNATNGIGGEREGL